jgi:hypothetical protein
MFENVMDAPCRIETAIWLEIILNYVLRLLRLSHVHKRMTQSFQFIHETFVGNVVADFSSNKL